MEEASRQFSHFSLNHSSVYSSMEKLISSQPHPQSVPESYVLPPESRPGETEVPRCETIPVIDLGGELGLDGGQLIEQIIQASQEFGFFQVINHGVPEKLMHDVLDAANQFFDLPAEDKARLYSEDPKQSCRLYTSIGYDRETLHYWRDNLRFSCHPLEEHMNFWPEKPPHFRDVLGRYSA